jgi:hypothetical protein
MYLSIASTKARRGYEAGKIKSQEIKPLGTSIDIDLAESTKHW